MAMVEEQKQVVGRVQEDGTVQQPEETKAYLALIKMQGGEHTWEMFLGIKYGKPATEEGKAYGTPGEDGLCLGGCLQDV